MIISHAHRFIFLKTCKTAGSSVEIALAEICGPRDVITPIKDPGWNARAPQNYTIPSKYQPTFRRYLRLIGRSRKTAGTVYYNHMPAELVRRSIDPEIWRDYLKITIERNPWDREVSLYFFRYPTEDRPTFEEFVFEPGPHICNFEIYSIDGNIVADLVLRYETLASDFSNLLRRLEVPDARELPKAKGSYRPITAADYRDYYTPRTRDAIAGRYAREIEAFGYTF